MSPQDDKIMFLIHNFSRPDIWYRYRDEFHTRIQDDFPSLVDEDCIESISDDGVLLLRTTDRRDIHKIFTRFYTPHILSLY